MAVNLSTESGSRRANRREIAAQATRQEILNAARRLFVERGFPQTSMADIAEAAGVSIPTIYASIGPKPAVVRALGACIELTAGARAARARAGGETDPVSLVGIAAHVTREMSEQWGDVIAALRDAAGADPEIARTVKAGRRQHQAGSRTVARRLTALGRLRPEVTAAEAADVIDLLASVETYARLVGDLGWSYGRAEAWVTDALVRLLLDPGSG